MLLIAIKAIMNSVTNKPYYQLVGNESKSTYLALYS